VTGDFVGLSFLTIDNQWQVESRAAYAQLTIPFDVRRSATFGARFTDETYGLRDRIDPLDPKVIFGSVNRGRQQFASARTTYTARLQYDNGPLLLYGGVITGFKGGSLSASNPASDPVKPEVITSVETGFKWSARPGLLVNGALFRYQYDNIQISLTNSITGAVDLVNGPSATVSGAEMQSSYRVNSWLTLRGNAIALRSHYDRDVTVSTGSVSILRTQGRRLAGAPQFAWTIGSDAVFATKHGGKSRVAVDALVNGGVFFDAENNIGSGGIVDRRYTIVDASLHYEPNNTKWRVSLYGTNLFNQKYYTGGLVLGGINLVGFPAAPATYGIRFQTSF
jgi:iron complex outermembrane receptor protein